MTEIEVLLLENQARVLSVLAILCSDGELAELCAEASNLTLRYIERFREDARPEG